MSKDVIHYFFLSSISSLLSVYISQFWVIQVLVRNLGNRNHPQHLLSGPKSEQAQPL